ncbi:lysophospholipid acyltransferase family protein [Mycoplasma struthionis]|uniref:1-acyl-sn-glycerol-3-phosphate acyltransferase n=1 Tax=Mycoplasma struthionis TaxID=538220 RepID=A0A502M8W6_9MOLU|nr:lysophospholipid acyltransferase family protein [Mycoplasma struthionis]TPI01928.1 1-acyl-sn-glycerol-3-phosphate acyltransferase [Mycoplasma struthionis]
MTLKTRVFFRMLPILSNIWSLEIKSRRFKKMPDYYKVEERNHFLQKHSAKILKHLNIELDIKGVENVPNSPCLIIPNHSTYLDPFFLWSALWNHGDGNKRSRIVNFLARKETKNKRSVKLISYLGDTYFIDTQKPREALETLTAFGQFVKRNKSCGVIYPEGTRTRDGKLGNFNTGAFRVAQSTFLPIVPVTINNAANSLDWKRKGKLVVEIIFHNQLKPVQFHTLDPKALTERVKEIIQKDYKEQVITSKETLKNNYTKRENKN